MELARVIAKNTAPQSENRMHDDRIAAQYGFQGGLVPGVTVYGYMAAPLGMPFLKCGGISLRLARPFYEGDEVVIDQIDSVTITANDKAGEIYATGVLRETPAPSLLAFPEGGLPAARPDATPESLAVGKVLGTIHRSIASVEAGLLLELSNRLLMENVRLGPWIHAASELQHFGLPREAEGLSVRGRVVELFEKAGHRFVVYETVVLGDDLRLIQHVRHTAIYEPRKPSPKE